MMLMTSIRKDLEKRAQQAILKNMIENYTQAHTNWFKEPAIRKAILDRALYSVPNALIIGLFIIAFGMLAFLIFPLLGWSFGFGVLVSFGSTAMLALIVEAIFLYFSISNEKSHAQAVANLFKVNFTPVTIQNKNLKAKLDKALEYWSLIDDAVNNVPQGVLRDRLESTTQEVTHWLQAVYNLAERVDKFELNNVIKRDLENVPREIQTYKKRLREEDNPEVHRQLEKTIADKERHLQTLQNLQNNMEKADYQLESTISSLGTIYSQLLLVGSKDESGSRISRLQEEVSEQVHRLEDLTEAMDEVYQESV